MRRGRRQSRGRRGAAGGRARGVRRAGGRVRGLGVNGAMASGQCGGFGVPKGARASERRRRTMLNDGGVQRGLQPAQAAGREGSGWFCCTLVCLLGVRVRSSGMVNKVFISPPSPGVRWRQPGRNNRAQTNILMHWLAGAHGTLILWHKLLGYRRPVKRCEQPDRPVATRVRGRGRTGRLEGLLQRGDVEGV